MTHAFIITKTVAGLGVYAATKAQALAFEHGEGGVPDNVTGHVIKDAMDLQACSLSLVDAAFLYTQSGEGSVKKFKTKSDAAARLYPVLDKLANDYPWADRPLDEAPAPTPAPATSERVRTRSPKGHVNLTPILPIRACRAGTKQAALVDALAKGATQAQLLEATSESSGGQAWTWASVKSGMSYDLNKLKGYGISSEEVDGEIVYRLVLPAGMAEPLPHTARKTA